jgi:hypothetical protein
MRQKLRQDPLNAKKLDDAANTALRYARAQLKRDQVIDPAELRTFCLKPVSEPTTGEDVIESIRKTAYRLREGKVTNCPDLDNSQEVQDIIRACTKRLVAIAKAKNPNGAAAPAPTKTTKVTTAPTV